MLLLLLVKQKATVRLSAAFLFSGKKHATWPTTVKGASAHAQPLTWEGWDVMRWKAYVKIVR